MLRLLLPAALLAAPALAETVKLRSGRERTGRVLSVDAESVRLEDGESVPRAEVEEIQFALRKAEEAPRAPDPQAAARGRELFRLSAELEKAHPGSDGIVLRDESEHVMRADGTRVERARFAGRMLKKGVQQYWARVSRRYEEGRDRVRVLRADVHLPDGRVVTLDPAKVQHARPQGDDLFFDEYRVMTYELPQAELGAIVDWELEVETYNPFRKDFFFPSWGFQNYSPTHVSRFSVTLPAGQSLHYNARNFDGPWAEAARPKVESVPGGTRWSWELRDVPAIVPEPRMSQYLDHAPSVKAAPFKDWDRIYDWLARMHEERSRPSPELAAFTAELVKGCRSDEEKTAAIYHYVQQQIRYVAVKIGVASGWGGYDANLTWKRRFGCCIDKALLFTAMLKAVGIPSSAVLLDPNHQAEHDFSVPSIWFSHAITAVKLAGRRMYLDSTGYDHRYPSFPAMDHGVGALDPLERRWETIEPPKPEENASRLSYAIQLSTGGDAPVRFSESRRGPNEADWRGYYKRIKGSELEKYFRDWINGIGPSAELLEHRVENVDDLAEPLEISATFRLKDYPLRAGDLQIFKLPDLERGSSDVALEKRRYDIEYPAHFEERARYEIEFPPGIEPASFPSGTLSGPGESYELGCRSEPGKLLCESVLRRERRIYRPAQYAEHKSFLERVSRLTRDRIFLRRSSAP